MPRRRAALRIGLPLLIVAGLTLLALWQISRPRPAVSEPGTPQPGETAAAPAPAPAPMQRPPVTRLAETRAADAIGRLAALDGLLVRDIPSPRTLWLEDGTDRLFAVLDPDVKRASAAPLTAGDRIAIVGLVRRPPRIDAAVRDWRLDAATARRVEQDGRYLYITELRTATEP